MSSLFLNLNDPVIFQSFGGEEYWSRVAFKEGEVILPEGEESQDFYYLFSGLVKVSKSIKDAHQTQKYLATLAAGDFFGEGALLSDKNRGATVQALEDTVVLKLPRQKFERLILQDAQAAVGIILGIVRVLNARLQDMNERLVTLQRIAELTREHGHNPAEIIPLVLKDLETLTHHGQLVFFTKEGQLRFSTGKVDEIVLATLTGHVGAVLKSLESSSSDLFITETEAFLVLRGGNGVTGLIAAVICPRCQMQDPRFLFLVSQELGHLA